MLTLEAQCINSCMGGVRQPGPNQGRLGPGLSEGGDRKWLAGWPIPIRAQQGRAGCGEGLLEVCPPASPLIGVCGAIGGGATWGRGCKLIRVVGTHKGWGWLGKGVGWSCPLLD